MRANTSSGVRSHGEVPDCSWSVRCSLYGAFAPLTLWQIARSFWSLYGRTLVLYAICYKANAVSEPYSEASHTANAVSER